MAHRVKLIAGTLAAITLAMGGPGITSARADSILTGNFGADNSALVYISTSANTRGTLIGTANSWNPASALAATRLFGGMTYYINVEAINGDPGNSYSAGAFIGDFALTSGATFSNSTTHLVTGSAGWLGSYNDANYTNTAQPWLAPIGAVTNQGLNGMSPYGYINGISSWANFVWAADSESSAANGYQCAACTIDLQTVITTAVPEPSSWTVMLMGLAGIAGALGLRRKKAPAAR